MKFIYVYTPSFYGWHMCCSCLSWFPSSLCFVETALLKVTKNKKIWMVKQHTHSHIKNTFILFLRVWTLFSLVLLHFWLCYICGLEKVSTSCISLLFITFYTPRLLPSFQSSSDRMKFNKFCSICPPITGI